MNASSCSPDALRMLPPFSCLTDTQFTWILGAIRHRPYRARTCILHAGDTPDGLSIVLSGRVRVVHEDGEGHALIVADYGPNEFFGEMGLVNTTPCPASIYAIEDCETAFVPRKLFLECIEDNSAAAIYMLGTALDRLCAAHRKLAHLALMPVYDRVASVLLENAQEAHGSWLVKPGAEQIAAMVGASREMVSRVVRDMIGKGAVRRYKRKLIVLNRSALARASTKSAALRSPPRWTV